jgi:hypothetical protein
MSRKITIYEPGEQWKQQAACKGTDLNTFFDGAYWDYAKSICAECPVKKECLKYGLFYDLYGVWGGTTEKDRHGFGLIVDKRFVCNFGHDSVWNDEHVCHTCVSSVTVVSVEPKSTFFVRSVVSTNRDYLDENMQ